MVSRPTLIPRKQRRKEAKVAKKQRRVSYNCHRNRKVLHENSVVQNVPSIKSTLKKDVPEKSILSTDHKTGVSGVSRKPVKRVRWCPSVVPNVGEELESDMEDEVKSDTNESFDGSSEEEVREALGLPIIEKKKKLEVTPEPKKMEYPYEDQEIGYLERQLGLGGPSGSKKRDKLLKELTMLDGLDSDLLDFAANCLKAGNTDTGNLVEEDEFDEDESQGQSDSDTPDFIQDNDEVHSSVKLNEERRKISEQKESNIANSCPDWQQNSDMDSSSVYNGEVVSEADSDGLSDRSSESEDNKDINCEKQSNGYHAQHGNSEVTPDVQNVELEYLVKKLGLKGSQSKKKEAQLLRELTLLDGFDADIITLAEDCFKPGIGKLNLDCEAELSGNELLELEEDEEKEQDEGEERSTEDSDTNQDSTEIKSSKIRKKIGDDDEIGINQKNVNRRVSNGGIVTEKRVSENDYESQMRTSSAYTETGKYVPPALRAKREATALQKLRVTSNTDKSELENKAISAAIGKVVVNVTGLVNRVSEGNLRTISAQIGEDMFTRGHTFAHKYYSKLIEKFPGIKLPLALSIEASASLLSQLATCLSQKIIAASVESLNSTVSLIASQSACIAALTARISFRICQNHISELVKSFERNWVSVKEFFDKVPHSNKADENNEEETDVLFGSIANIKSYLRHAIISISLLFDFGLLDGPSIFSFIRRLFDNFISPNSTSLRTSALPKPVVFETQIDLLLYCLRHASARLRSQFAADFRDILAFVFSIIKIYDSSTSSHENMPNSRLSYLIKELEDIKNGKINSHSSDRLQFIRSWLFNGRDFEDVQWSKYLFSLTSLDSSVEKGSKDAWYNIANSQQLAECPAGRFERHSDTKRMEDISRMNKSDDRMKLLQLAEEQRLHTDLQKCVFIALMEAENPQHGVQRILEVAHQKHEVPHIVAVTMHISLRQRVFNPFFPQVLLNFCLLPSAIGSRFKRAVKQGIAAQLTTCHQFPLLNLMNFAKLIAYLVSRCIRIFTGYCLSADGILELRVIRFLNNDALVDPNDGVTGKLGLFLGQVCIAFCETEGSTSEEQQMIDTLFETHFQKISPMTDIANHLCNIVGSLVIPELKKKGLNSVAIDKAKQIEAILAEK